MNCITSFFCQFFLFLLYSFFASRYLNNFIIAIINKIINANEKSGTSAGSMYEKNVIFSPFEKRCFIIKKLINSCFIVIISFVLIFSMPISCFAKDSNSGAAGWSSWSTGEKVHYCEVYGVDILSAVTGVVQGDPSAFKDFILDIYAATPDSGVTNFYEYLANGLSFDDDTETWTLSDDLVDFCNQLIVNYNDKVTMMYRYPFRPDYLEADWFPNKTMYTYFVDMVKKHPEYYFDVFVEADNQTLSFFVYRSDDCLSAVNANFDLIIAPCALYNSDWLQNVEGYFMTLNTSCSLRVFENISSGLSSPSTEFTSFDEAIAKGTKMSFTFPQSNCMRTDNIKWSLPKWNRLNSDYLVSSHEGAINCYKSLADMKKDLGSQVIGKYTPDYTGTASSTVTQNTVNNVTNNYYGDNSGGGSGSGGSGSDDSGSSSGIFGGLAKIVGAIVNGIASIIDAIVAPIERIISSIVGLFKDFIDAITSFADLYDSNIPLFFKDVFSFLPDKLVTVLTTSLLLVIIVAVIKFLRG